MRERRPHVPSQDRWALSDPPSLEPSPPPGWPRRAFFLRPMDSAQSLSPNRSPSPAKSRAGSGGWAGGHTVKGCSGTVVAGPSLGREGRGLQTHPRGPCYLPPSSPPLHPQAGLGQTRRPRSGGCGAGRTQGLCIGCCAWLPGREAGSLPCLGPRLNAWVGKESRGFGVWSPHFPLPGPAGREGPLRLAARWADSDLLRPLPFCGLWDTPTR